MCGKLSIIAAFATISIYSVAESGFVNAPCAPRNTALLNPSHPFFPENEPVQCVDMTEMSRCLDKFQKTWPIHTATSLFGDNMHLPNISRNVLQLMPKLEFIDFSSNKIKLMPLSLGRTLPKLKTLILEKNSVRIPKKRALFRSTTIETLQLSHNKIRQIQSFTFSKMPSLRVLYLDSNYIKDIQAKMFSHLANLKYLHLGNNLLKNVPAKFEMPPNLKTFIIKGNEALDEICRKSVRRVYPC